MGKKQIVIFTMLPLLIHSRVFCALLEPQRKTPSIATA